jgi:fumarate reductase flavoprotein subunit
MVSGSVLQGLQSEYDLVVIGGGGSGLSAALAAAEQGISKIVVLEKRINTGGNTARATGLLGCESTVQARSRVMADKDELFKKAMNWAHWARVNPRVFRAFLNKSGDTIHWLEQMGLEFEVIAFFPNQTPRTEHVPKGKGAQLMKVLAEKCTAAGVHIALHCAGTRLQFDTQQKIAGVIAESENSRIEIRAKSVIIATGGFAGNKAMLKERCPHYYDDMPVRGLTLMGDGITLALEAGVAVDNSIALLKEGPRVAANSWPLGGLERDPFSVWVNKYGRRFTDESIGDHPFESGNAVMDQPDKVCFSLVDSVIKQKVMEKAPRLLQAIPSEADNDRIKVANSWVEIAQWIGVAAEKLKSTVDQYNEICSKGYDTEFAKPHRCLIPLLTPPFYAIRGYPYILDTLGGIKINELMQALTVKDEPVTGLFAAGVTTSGWEAEYYCSDLSGSAFGYAINSGRIAGENAARFIKFG